MFWKSMNFAEYCACLYVVIVNVHMHVCWMCRDLDNCSKQRRGMSQYPTCIIATYVIARSKSGMFLLIWNS